MKLVTVRCQIRVGFFHEQVGGNSSNLAIWSENQDVCPHRRSLGMVETWSQRSLFTSDQKSSVPGSGKSVNSERSGLVTETRLSPGMILD
jgi:hypothetical protein